MHLGRLINFCLVLFLLTPVELMAKPRPADLVQKRIITFRYTAKIPPVEPGAGPVDIFLPLATSDDNQKVLKREIKAPFKGEERTEEIYGNSYWYAQLEHTNNKEIPIHVDYTVERKVFSNQVPLDLESTLHEEELKHLTKFLKPNKLVPVSGELIEKIRADFPKTEPKPHLRARAIYDYVVENMEYKKVGTGWGNGDTYWACSKKYGNCTDFHALFISLARAEGIPSRFEIGFPIPESKAEGKVGGYHCWVTFYLPQVGWVPIDASEAKKNLERKELLYGTHPADRILFTVGRDLRLGDEQQSPDLNYFIYPHVEVAGKRLPKVSTEFKFSQRDAASS